MPELPEVETIRRGLEPRLLGATIAAVEVRDRRLRWGVDPAALARLRTTRFVSVRRRAKYLLLDTSASQTLLVHLGMSGRLLLTGADEAVDPHDHVRWQIRCADGRSSVELRFRDPRRFGCVLVVARDRIGSHRLLAHLGPEPLGPDFTGEHLRDRARGSRRPVKNFLMDARVVTGIGNIYASESLWRARVHPRARAGRISLRRCRRIRDASVDVLEQALHLGGTTLSDYRDSEGNLGYFGLRLQAYGRESEACSRCGRGIRRIVMAGRATYYCPGCQH